MNHTYDCIVAGAGPAGFSAAWHLSLLRPGARILQIEKKTFPREKVCGDVWGPRAIGILRKCGAYDAFRGQGFHNIEGCSLITPYGKSYDFRNPGRALIIPRKTSDHLLRNRLLDREGVESLEGVKVTGVIRENDRVTGVICLDRGGEETRFRAPVVIDASGTASPISRRINPEKITPSNSSSLMRAYYSDVKLDRNFAEIIYHRGVPGYFWIFPMDPAGGKANVGLGIFNRYLVNQRELTLEKAFRKIVEENPLASRRLAHATREGPAGHWAIAYHTGKIAIAEPGLLLTGDAANFVEPYTGGGIYFGLLSGKLAAGAAARALGSGGFGSGMTEHYRKLCRRHIIPRIRFRPAIFEKLPERPPLYLRASLTTVSILLEVVWHLGFFRRRASQK